MISVIYLNKQCKYMKVIFFLIIAILTTSAFGQQESKPVTIKELQKRAGGFEIGTIYLVVYDPGSNKSLAYVSSPNFQDRLKAVNSRTPIIKTQESLKPDFSLTIQFYFVGNILEKNIEQFDLYISAKGWSVLDTEPLILKCKGATINLGIDKTTAGEKATKKDEATTIYSHRYKISRDDLITAVKSGKLKFTAGTKEKTVIQSGRTAFKYILKLGTL